MQLGRLVLNSPAVMLSWLGRQGPRAVAALIVIGIALPPIGALFKPFVTEAVFVLLCIAFLRVEAAAFRSYSMDICRNPGLVRRDLPGTRSQGAVTRPLPSSHASSNGAALDGSSRVGCVDT